MATHIVHMVKMKQIASIFAPVTQSIVLLTAIIEICALAHQGISNVCQEAVYFYGNCVTKQHNALMHLMNHQHACI